MKYVVLGNPDEWCYYSWYGVLSDDNIRFYRNVEFENPLADKIWRIHRNHANWPLNKICYRLLKRVLELSRDEESTLIVYDWHILTRDLDFFRYIRLTCPRVRIVYLFSNIVEKSGAITYGILKKIKDYFDIVFAFDKQDADKYGFDYFPLIYTKNDQIVDVEAEYDLFYVGQAKDRYEQLLEIFESAKQDGLKCNFNIFGVNESIQKYPNEITYNKKMPYFDVLRCISESRCLVDAIQGRSTGLTIKTCESVIYNKKLITTNQHLINEPFYTQDRVLLWSKKESIASFLGRVATDYTEEEKKIFSPYRLFDEINKLLGE